MFLHLGADMVVPLRDVIAITDLKSGKSSINKEFLDKMEDESLLKERERTLNNWLMEMELI